MAVLPEDGGMPAGGHRRRLERSSIGANAATSVRCPYLPIHPWADLHPCTDRRWQPAPGASGFAGACAGRRHEREKPTIVAPPPHAARTILPTLAGRREAWELHELAVAARERQAYNAGVESTRRH